MAEKGWSRRPPWGGGSMGRGENGSPGLMEGRSERAKSLSPSEITVAGPTGNPGPRKSRGRNKSH